jgi:Rrf2 family protein
MPVDYVNLRQETPYLGSEGKVMLVTREADYAIRTVLYLAKNSEGLVSVDKIAQAMHIPRTFLAKLLQRLVKNRILLSSRGVNGGFQLAVKPSELTLLAILEAIQGPSGINICAVDSDKCSLSGDCFIHPIWVDIRKQIDKRLARETIAKILSK